MLEFLLASVNDGYLRRGAGFGSPLSLLAQESQTLAQSRAASVARNIEAVSGSPAQHRPGTHERIVWEGEAADKAEALKCAEKADPRVDLEWMRIRHERDLDIR